MRLQCFFLDIKLLIIIFELFVIYIVNNLLISYEQ